MNLIPASVPRKMGNVSRLLARGIVSVELSISSTVLGGLGERVVPEGREEPAPEVVGERITRRRSRAMRVVRDKFGLVISMELTELGKGIARIVGQNMVQVRGQEREREQERAERAMTVVLRRQGTGRGARMCVRIMPAAGTGVPVPGQRVWGNVSPAGRLQRTWSVKQWLTG
ncbi:hypothetical protein A2721_00105 [Candidatus Gottesmanbacteria bacterium RIFCSPHIGHO2_01_FULL_47_48]|uniref:Uncharacterized protein n=1 Tax=Candidatus Gottesmanbacteria bacterium RIFCSPHIGHO2_01_FULL_47_48 TaxID=1798381 RepID=A0A1F6A3M9_9BACT|nr:MAG: hypothetical protein A2721_00105 [Candidatus Gottesmanbacteria bacterium RIFCSPHIGHO2_01_FULL_47_48]